MSTTLTFQTTPEARATTPSVLGERTYDTDAHNAFDVVRTAPASLNSHDKRVSLNVEASDQPTQIEETTS